MKTDKKVMAAVLRKAADNLENGVNPISDIQFKNAMGAWIDKGSLDIDENVEYRIKPKTIIVNGVEIPKPLEHSEFKDEENYFFVSSSKYMFNYAHVDWIKDQGIKFVYKTKEEAIEASKALFGIED